MLTSMTVRVGLINTIVPLLLASQEVSITARHPTAPDHESLSYSVRCHNHRLEVLGYNGTQPGQRAPEIRINGRRARGVLAESLRRDLAGSEATYNIGGRCLPEGDGILLFIYVGERDDAAEGLKVDYRLGRAYIRNGRIDRYDGLIQTGPAGFWF